MILKKIITFLLLAFFANVTIAQTRKYSNEFMNIGADARALGMSKSVVSSVNDVTAGYWNPAGLVRIQDNIQLGGMHSPYFGNLATYNYGGVAYKIDKNSAFSFSMVRFAVDDIPNTTQLVDANGVFDYSKITSFSVGDYGFLLSYAKKSSNIDALTMGGSAKIIYRQAGDFASAVGFGIDLGAQYEMDNWVFAALAKDITSTFNAWSFNTKEFDDVLVATGNEIPQNGLEITLPSLILGTSYNYEINKKMTILGEINMDVTFDGKRNTLISASPISVAPHLGFEAAYIEKVFLRAGLGQIQQVINDSNTGTEYLMQPNAGIGVKLNNLNVDYALANIGSSLGTLSHVVSLRVGITKR